MSNESKKSKKTAATPDAAGRVRLETADGAEMFDPATWVEPASDGSTKIEGTLERAFVMVDQLGARNGKPFRSAYVIRDTETGFEWTVGEKAFFRRAIRKLRIGTKVELGFTKKEDMIDAKTGEPDGRTIWRGDLFVIGPIGRGALLSDVLAESHAELIEKGEHLPY